MRHDFRHFLAGQNWTSFASQSNADGNRTLKKTSYSVALIILLTIGIVAGPVLLSGFRVECAHWYLAAAVNAIELGGGDGQSQLDAARRWYPQLDELQDYWTVRLKQAKRGSSEALMALPKEMPANRKFVYGLFVGNQLVDDGKLEEAAQVVQWLLEVGDGEELGSAQFLNLLVKVDWKTWGAARAVEQLRAAVERSQSARRLALEYSIEFGSEHEFEASLESLKLYYGKEPLSNSIDLNQLAYARSLAHVELDEALVDINRALELRTEGWPMNPIADEASLRDTRAWILFRMGKLEEALADAEFAVKAFERPSLLQKVSNWLIEVGSQTKPSQSETDAEPSGAPTYLTEKEVPREVWSLGVMRYHRAKILESLRRSEAAQADWDWLALHRLPPDDRLH